MTFMELSFVKISFLNDFIFCPRSIYFHNVYSFFDKKVYQGKVQVSGSLSHEYVEKKKSYFDKKSFFHGIDVFSEKLSLIGKIDLYDFKNKVLIERKNFIKKIYDGYLYQVYAQFFCLKEMGFEVKKIFFYSMKDNKKYEVPLPSEKEFFVLKRLVDVIKNFSLNDDFTPNINKCKKCIYKHLCDKYVEQT